MHAMSIDRRDKEIADLARRVSKLYSSLCEINVNCHSQRDGDCIWERCPQLRDGEPKKSGRHCPLDWRSANDEYHGA